MYRPDVIIEVKAGAIPVARLINKAVKAAAPFLRGQPSGTFAVLVTTNAKIRSLNHDYRGKDKATNVLSFPQFAPRELKKLKPKQEVYLGDIALSLRYCVAESKRLKKPVNAHLMHLIVHGLLHLLGYDHGSDKQAAAMEGLEKKILHSLGLPDPYETPAKTPKVKPKA